MKSNICSIGLVCFSLPLFLSFTSIEAALQPPGQPLLPTPAKVKIFGSMNRLILEGNDSFDAQSIKRSLLMNPDFLIASHESAPFKEYLSVLMNKILSGYRSNGFPHVGLHLKFIPERGSILVKIDEGPRYVCGPININGNTTVPVDSLVKRLTQSWPPPKSSLDKDPSLYLDNQGEQIESKAPIWEIGEPADFSENSTKALKGSILYALTEFDLFFPDISLELKPNDKEKTVALNITFIDEGPAGTIRKILISGNTINSTESVLKYLSLKDGMPLTRSLLKRTRHHLWKSARFLYYQVTPVRVKDKRAVLDLHIQLLEQKDVSTLDQQFTRVEKAFLTLRKRMLGIKEKNEDLIFSIKLKGHPFVNKRSIQIILSGKGFMISSSVKDNSNGSSLETVLLISGEDFNLLFDGDTYITDTTDQMAKYFKNFDEKHLKSITAILPAEYKELVQTAWKDLNNPKGKSIKEILWPIFDSLWKRKIRSIVKKELHELATSTY